MDIADPQETSTITRNGSKSIDEAEILQQNVRNAMALGWAIVELLGRCFALPEEKPATIAWSGDKLVMLQETYTPREKIRALTEHIFFVAGSLNLSSYLINHDVDHDNNKRDVDVLQDDIEQLSQVPSGPAADEARARIRGKINKRLFFWDLKIQDALQNKPTVVHKAYMVGRSLAALRWYLGLQNEILDDAFREKICHEYIPLLAPYVSPFATGALAYSVDSWGKAISAGQVKPGLDGPEGKAPPELQKQADIWYSLATGERSSLTYLDPSVASRPYILRLLRISWPLFLVSIILLLLVVALLLFIVFSHFDVIITAITAAAGFLAALGITHAVVTALGGILQKAMSGDILENAAAKAVGVIKVSMIDSVWNSTQQQAVNKATFIPPAGTVQKVARK